VSDSDNMKADVSVFYTLREFPNVFVVCVSSFLEFFEEMLRDY
jgi:hypothetical protein